MQVNEQKQLEFWTSDKKFGVVVLPKALAEILQFSIESSGLETGGIAMGRYSESHTCAIVDRFTGPPTDSQRGTSTFVRGVRGLQTLLTKLWTKERRYYLGEWHYHPGASANPSSTDLSQMRAIASDPNYACPEPLLFILGGNPKNKWELKIVLTHSSESHVELKSLISWLNDTPL